MALVLTAGPTAEPISIADAKAHLPIDTNNEDILIGSLILTSRLHIEAALGLAEARREPDGETYRALVRFRAVTESL